MNSNEYNNEVTVVVMHQKNGVVNDLHLSWIMCKTPLVVCFIEQIYNACNELIKRCVLRARRNCTSGAVVDTYRLKEM